MILWILLFLVLAAFSLGLVFGAPYLPTRSTQAVAALDLMALKPGQTVLDLGSGDGSFLIAAARRSIRAIGYEINPFLYLISILRTWRYRRLVTVRYGDFWRVEWPRVDGIYIFLIGRYMDKLAARLKQLNHPVAVASYAFEIPGHSKAADSNGIFLYRYGS